jgi:DGQHR domain-containing protein
LRFPSIRIAQWGYGKGAGKTDIYVASMTVKDLEKASLDRWTRGSRTGYQRAPSEERFGTGRGSIVNYLLEELGAFPTSVLINIRGELKFEPKSKISDNIEFGEVIIPDNEKPILIDGQHRLEALKRASHVKPELLNYPLPVSIMNLKEKFDEMVHFYMVNSRQKKIPTDLVYRQLQIFSEKAVLGGKDWVKSAILGPKEQRAALASFIVDYFDENTKSPFYGLIQYTGEEREPHHLVKDFALSRYISTILKEKALSGISPEKFADLLSDYWSAIKELYPECFTKPREYRLLKTTGIACYTYLFPTIFAYCAAEGKITKPCFTYYLSMLKQEIKSNELDSDFKRPIDETWWSMAHGPAIASATSETMFDEIVGNMTKKIEIAMKRMDQN